MATVRYQITLPEEVAKQLDKQAETERRNRSNMISYIVTEYLKMQQKDAE